MGVSLEWAHLPSGIYLKTICRNGIPLPDVTHYLLVVSASPVGSVRTPRVYAHLLLPFHIWLDHNGIRLPDVSINDLMRFKQDLRSPECKALGLLRKGAETSDTTLVQTVNSTVRFLQWALGPQSATPLRKWHEGIIPSQVSFSLLGPQDGDLLRRQRSRRPKRRLPRYLTQEQMDQCRVWIMTTYAFDPSLQIRNRAIFELLFDGALRRGALLGLRVNAIEWAERIVRVTFDDADYRKSWYVKTPTARTAKTGEYEVFLADETIQWLDRYRQEARPHEALQQRHGIFFCQHVPGGANHGQPLTVHALRHLFESMSLPADKGGAGVHITPHMLRHTWNVMAEADGLPVEVRKAHLGHTSITSTDLYSGISSAQVRTILTQWRTGYPHLQQVGREV